MKRPVYFSTGFVLFIALVILWIPWLGETLFYSKGEPREAVVAVSMLQQGDWVLPVSCGSDIPYKPPFLAWLIAIFATVFNGGTVNEFVSRLPSALAAIFLVMATFSWAKKERGERFALYMSLILATSIEFYRAAVACRVDMVLTACMVGAMYVLYSVNSHRGSDNFWRYCVATVLLTCATLTKGPVGALLPCLVMGLYFLFSGHRFFPTLGRMTALCVASFVVPAVWYYYAWQHGGSEFLQLVWEENFQRLAGTMPYESHVKPFWYNFLTIIVGMLPWTLLVIMSVSALRRLVQQPFKQPGLMAVTAVATIVIFYCIPSSKRSVYLLPAYPFMAYGVASIAEALIETRINTAFSRVLAFVAIATPAVLIATRFYPILEFRFEPQSWWAYILLILPMAVAIGWLIQAHPRGAVGGACLISWAMLVAYGGAVMPAAMNPLSDKEDAAMLASLADGKPIYIVGPDKHTAVAYGLNYYLDDCVGRVPNAAAADSCPTGTVLIFPNLADTAGLPPTYHLTLLKRRLSDTRRGALFAVQTGAPVIRRHLSLDNDSLAREMPAESPEAIMTPPAGMQATPRREVTRRDSTPAHRVTRINRDSADAPIIARPTAKPQL